MEPASGLPAHEGRRFPTSRLDGHHLELWASGAMLGEKLPCYRSDLLRQFPFPERFGDNSHIPEGVVWMPIGEAYLVRCIDQIVRAGPVPEVDVRRRCQQPVARLGHFDHHLAVEVGTLGASRLPLLNHQIAARMDR